MRLTPQEIQSQQFHVRFRGFDVEEVDGFLEQVAEEFLALLEENKRLQGQLESLEQDLTTYQRQEKTFQNAFLSAQKIADEIKGKSREEAEEILATAQAEAKQLRESANAEIADLESEVDRLETMKMEIRAELKALLESYLARLDETPAARQRERIEEAAAEAEVEAAEEEDLSDLYERIELPLEEEIDAEKMAAAVESIIDLTATAERSPDEEAEESGRQDEDPEEETASAIPDLDGDLVFSLEDPLDAPEPAVTFDEQDSDDADRGEEEK